MLPQIEIGGLLLPSYWVMLLIAVAAGTTVAVERGRRDGIAPRSILFTALVASTAGVLGARAWSALIEHATLVGRFDVHSLWTTSGLGVFGGLVGGAAAVWLVSRLRRDALLPIVDTMAPGFAAGLSIGRLGCLLAGCCFGKPTLFPIAIVFHDFACAARPIGVPLHATQIYECVGAAVVGVGLWFAPARHRGLRLGLLLLAYGMLRGALETLRYDYRGWVGAVSASTLGSLAAATVGAALLAAIAFCGRRRVVPG